VKELAMRKTMMSLALLATLSLGTGADAQSARVRLLATGGTIAGAQPKPGEYGYKSGAFSVEDLIKAVPNLDKLAVITGEQVANIGSQDMNDEVWLKLAGRLSAALASPDVDGVVITHGTDTLEETGYFLSLVTHSDKPVVMVGSMRPATAISADGPGNLYNAVAIATNPGARGRGVLVELNDEIDYARNVQKTNTSSVQTFSSVNRGPAGLVNTGKITWFQRMDKKQGASSAFSVDGLTKLPRVDILYAYPNMSVDLIDAAVKDGAQGIVIAGVGDGNMTQQALDRVTQAAKAGVVVVRASRVGSGIVYRNNEVNDDQLGLVASGELSPGKARVLLQLALTKTKDPAQIQQMFNEY
jgi:L-asparaginase